MPYPSLENLINKIKSSPRVKGIFITGSTASGLKPYSDIDLVIVLDKNVEKVKAIYTTIENYFADIFFYDIDFINKIKNKQEVPANNFDGLFLSWLAMGKIKYDSDGILLALRKKIIKNKSKLKVHNSNKKDFWVKVNYNFLANMRYYNSKNKLYHQALELRLLYSVIEIVAAYFSFRDIPWRGEKAAINYFKKNNPEFLKIFQQYSQSKTLKDRIKYYQKLLDRVFFGEHQKWDKNFIVPITNKNQYNQKLVDFWNNLVE